jgi:hypothetical protein
VRLIVLPPPRHLYLGVKGKVSIKVSKVGDSLSMTGSLFLFIKIRLFKLEGQVVIVVVVVVCPLPIYISQKMSGNRPAHPVSWRCG